MRPVELSFCAPPDVLAVTSTPSLLILRTNISVPPLAVSLFRFPNFIESE